MGHTGVRLGEAPFDVLISQYSTGNHDLSPDGQWLFYTSNETGRLEMYVGPFSNPDAKVAVSTDGSNQGLWSPGGDELFFRSLDGRRMTVVSVETEPTLSIGPPRLLFEGNLEPGDFGGLNFDVSPDGERFLMVQSPEATTPSGDFRVVLNWTSELERMLPTQ